MIKFKLLAKHLLCKNTNECDILHPQTNTDQVLVMQDGEVTDKTLTEYLKDYEPGGITTLPVINIEGSSNTVLLENDSLFKMVSYNVIKDEPLGKDYISLYYYNAGSNYFYVFLSDVLSISSAHEIDDFIIPKNCMFIDDTSVIYKVFIENTNYNELYYSVNPTDWGEYYKYDFISLIHPELPSTYNSTRVSVFKSESNKYVIKINQLNEATAIPIDPDDSDSE